MLILRCDSTHAIEAKVIRMLKGNICYRTLVRAKLVTNCIDLSLGSLASVRLVDSPHITELLTNPYKPNTLCPQLPRQPTGQTSIKAIKAKYFTVVTFGPKAKQLVWSESTTASVLLALDAKFMGSVIQTSVFPEKRRHSQTSQQQD